MSHQFELKQVRDEFLCAASHELRTPLTSLKLQVGVMRRLADDDRIRKWLGSADREVSRMVQLVDQLMEAARISSGGLVLKLDLVNAAELARDAIANVRIGSGAVLPEIRLFADREATGIWDRTRIERVLGALLSNAVQFGQGKPIDVSIAREGLRVLISVRDRGPGITAEDQTRIFERYERAVPAKNFAGLGLGLFVSREIVSAHGGRIRVESQPGSGSLFVVELPASALSGAIALPAPRAA